MVVVPADSCGAVDPGRREGSLFEVGQRTADRWTDDVWRERSQRGWASSNFNPEDSTFVTTFTEVQVEDDCNCHPDYSSGAAAVATVWFPNFSFLLKKKTVQQKDNRSLSL